MQEKLSRILVITNDRFPHEGGASTHIEHLMSRSSQTGIHIDVVSWSSVAGLMRLCARVAQRAVRTVTGDTMLALKVAAGFLAVPVRDALCRTRYSAINPQSALAMLACKRARAPRLPIVLTVHTYWTYELEAAGLIPDERVRSRVQKMEAEAYAAADWILCVDTRIRNHVVAVCPTAATKTSVWYNAVLPDDTVIVSEELSGIRRKLGIQPHDFVFLCPRRLVPKNGVLELLEAYGLLTDREGCKLLFVGDGPLRGDLQRVIRERDMRGVVLAGSVAHSHMSAYYQLASVVVIPSHHTSGIEEATSYSALESLVYDKPLVATSIGGLREIFADGGALLVQDGDASALANALGQLRASESMREMLRLEGRVAMGRLRPENWIVKYVEVVDSLVRSR